MLEAVEGADVIVVADYGRGLAENAQLRKALSSRGLDVPVVWDPHPRGGRPVLGAAVATPNLPEATRAAGVQGRDATAAALAARALRDDWSCPIAVTLGELGVLLADSADAPASVHAVSPVTCVDACGAGDRFSSALAVALASGAALQDAVATAADVAALFLAGGGVSALGTQRSPRFSGHAPAEHGSAAHGSAEQGRDVQTSEAQASGGRSSAGRSSATRDTVGAVRERLGAAGGRSHPIGAVAAPAARAASMASEFTRERNESR
jgi:bifunctional ADP-heptose synthase (sugar kinase/adenylyltransferase)